MKRTQPDAHKEKSALLDELLDFAKGGMAKEMRARHGIEPEAEEHGDQADLEAEDPGTEEAHSPSDSEAEPDAPGGDGESEDVKAMLRKMAAGG